MTASAVSEQAVVTRWPAAAFVHGVQSLVCEPSTEKVFAAHAARIASAVVVHCVVMRWPGPAVEHAVQVPEFIHSLAVHDAAVTAVQEMVAPEPVAV